MGKLRVAEYRPGAAGHRRADGSTGPSRWYPARRVGRGAVPGRHGVRGQHLAQDQGALIMPRLSVWMIRTALIHLAIGFALGALLLAQRGMPLSPMIPRLR